MVDVHGDRADMGPPPLALATSATSVSTSLDFPADARSAGRARAFVGQFCSSAGVSGEVRRTASLLVSELVTNAIVHGRSGVTVDASLDADRVLRVVVVDDNPAPLPAVTPEPEASAESGRGLLIVSLLATRWGIGDAPTRGKAVWFELSA